MKIETMMFILIGLGIVKSVIDLVIYKTYILSEKLTTTRNAKIHAEEKERLKEIIDNLKKELTDLNYRFKKEGKLNYDEQVMIISPRTGIRYISNEEFFQISNNIHSKVLLNIVKDEAKERFKK